MPTRDSSSDQPKSKKLTRGRARQQFLSLVTPKLHPEPGDVDRDTWFSEVCNNFVSKSRTNREYYRVVLEAL